MIELKQADEIEPICPHCEAKIRTVLFKELSGVLGRRYVYFCGGCRKVLGVSHRKGFLMG